MLKRSRHVPDLVALNIEGEWNIPLLENAAALSGSDLVFGSEESEDQTSCGESPIPFDEIRASYDILLSCETAKRSRSIYEFPVPRGRVGLIVGNETCGIDPHIISRTDHVVSIPMYGKGMSSVNVAVAAAIALYVIDRDLARQPVPASRLRPDDVDLLIQSSSGPSELGSLLRSVWAFGWRKVFLRDGAAAWFSADRDTTLQARAAARRENNPLVVLSAEKMRRDTYSQVLWCSSQRTGTPLSRLRLPSRGPLLICYGDDPPDLDLKIPVEVTYVDHGNSCVVPRFRHGGSMLLSYVSRMLRRGHRG